MRGTFFEIATIVITLLLAVIFFAAALSGYFYKKLNFGIRIGAAIVAIAVTFLGSLPEIVNLTVVRTVLAMLLLVIALKPFYSRKRQKVDTLQRIEK